MLDENDEQADFGERTLPGLPLGIFEQHPARPDAEEQVSNYNEGRQCALQALILQGAEHSHDAYQSQQAHHPTSEEIVDGEQQLQHFIFFLSVDTANEDGNGESHGDDGLQGNADAWTVDDVLLKG